MCVRAQEREVAPLAIICIHFSTHIAILFIYSNSPVAVAGSIVAANARVSCVWCVCLCANWNGQMHKKFIYNTCCSNQYSWYCSKAATRHSITIEIGMRKNTMREKNGGWTCKGPAANDNARSKEICAWKKRHPQRSNGRPKGNAKQQKITAATGEKAWNLEQVIWLRTAWTDTVQEINQAVRATRDQTYSLTTPSFFKQNNNFINSIFVPVDMILGSSDSDADEAERLIDASSSVNYIFIHRPISGVLAVWHKFSTTINTHFINCRLVNILFSTKFIPIATCATKRKSQDLKRFI